VIRSYFNEVIVSDDCVYKTAFLLCIIYHNQSSSSLMALPLVRLKSSWYYCSICKTVNDSHNAVAFNNQQNTHTKNLAYFSAQLF